MRTQLATTNNINGAVLEKVLLGNDLSSLSPVEKVSYVKSICDSVGLNPITRPIQLIKFQGKEIPYFSKDATEQLRKLNNISIKITETKIIDDLYIVVTEATDTSGRVDSSTAAIVISGLKGDAKANALMKCETKAKRRVTLSICGLGFIDESEAESIPGAQKVQEVKVINDSSHDEKFTVDHYKFCVESCMSIDDLKRNWMDIRNSGLSKDDPQGYAELKKMVEDYKLKFVNQETGEVA